MAWFSWGTNFRGFHGWSDRQNLVPTKKLFSVWIMKENDIVMATNFEPNEWVIFAQSTKFSTHQNKANHSIVEIQALQSLCCMFAFDRQNKASLSVRFSVYWFTVLLPFCYSSNVNPIYHTMLQWIYALPVFHIFCFISRTLIWFFFSIAIAPRGLDRSPEYNKHFCPGSAPGQIWTRHLVWGHDHFIPTKFRKHPSSGSEVRADYLYPYIYTY